MSSEDLDVDSDKDVSECRPDSGSIAGSNGKRKNGPKKIKQEWEIMEGLRDGQRFEEKPLKFDGFLSKRRNPPLKGWHKRYFVLEEGMLTYSKTAYHLQKGKIHRSIDIGVSVLTFNRKKRKFDLDNEEFVCHLKAKTKEWFNEWIEHLRSHRLYRQNELSYGTRATPLLLEVMTVDPLLTDQRQQTCLDADTAGVPIHQQPCSSGVAATAPATAGCTHSAASACCSGVSPPQAAGGVQCAERAERRHGRLTRENSQLRSNSLLASQGKVIAWIIDTSGNEQYSRDLGTVEKTLDELQALIHQLSVQGALENSNSLAAGDDGQKKGGLMRKLSFKSANKSSRGKSPEVAASISGSASPRIGGNRLAVKNATSDDSPGDGHGEGAHVTEQWPVSLAAGIASDSRLHQGTCTDAFLTKSKEVLSMLKNLARRLNTERERLKAIVDKEPATGAEFAGGSSVFDDAGELRQKLVMLRTQNAELRARLALDGGSGDRITTAPAAAAADMSLLASVSEEQAKSAAVRQPALPSHVCSSAAASPPPPPPPHGDLNKTGSLDSHTSASDYFDALEYEYGNASSEASESETSTSSTERDDRDGDTEISEAAADEADGAVMSLSQRQALAAKCHTGRRSKLPAPKTAGGDGGLIQLLTRNIGKDLTRVSMPVTLNEPLSMLQLLCEELEYSDLLDKASSLRDPCERMAYVAAFATSAYSASVKRAGQKPFNPILGETYECLRDDLGWKFVAEQVSHHPPISACHAESHNFTFWQDVRIKTKFWGKSMEFHPSGTVNVILKKHNEHYQWNKVTTCLHNILAGQRWVDQYGDMLIKNMGQGITCKLTFVKASYWSDKKHEVNGMVCGSDGSIVTYLYGRWTEGLYTGLEGAARCIWRPGSFPEDHDRYYGFTRFAIELNELLSSDIPKLPPTDSRFRPDQRLLEEGRIPEAESEKLRVEKLQRDLKKYRDEQGIVYQPRWFRKYVAQGEEHYQYNHDYWKLRETPGFARMTFEPLW